MGRNEVLHLYGYQEPRYSGLGRLAGRAVVVFGRSMRIPGDRNHLFRDDRAQLMAHRNGDHDAPETVSTARSGAGQRFSVNENRHIYG
jgi:hypothetical protein